MARMPIPYYRCSRCNGDGSIEVPEAHSETDGPRFRVICAICEGKGYFSRWDHKPRRPLPLELKLYTCQ